MQCSNVYYEEKTLEKYTLVGVYSVISKNVGLMIFVNFFNTSCFVRNKMYIFFVLIKNANAAF